MATYRVDFSKPVNGSAGLTWEDAWNTFASLPSLVAGDIVEIRSGIMPATFTLGQSGSAGNPIIFRGDPTATQTQRIVLPTEGVNNISLASRSNITWENLDVEGLSTWTNQSTVAFVLGGAMSNIVFNNVNCQYARFEMSPGFNISNVQFIDSGASDCMSDGFRSFSSSATYTHGQIRFERCTFSRNGRALGANGAGISFLVQDGHTTCFYDDIIIIDSVIEDNNRAGIAIVGTGVAWATLISAGNTTPPDQRYRGVVINNNNIKRNGGAGLHLLGAKASSTNGVYIGYNIADDNGAQTTIGNLWTGACLSPVIEKNICRRAKSNGTVVGDGQGIFDDQWNDGAIVRYNLIENNVFNTRINPEYTAYGIGIFRCSNSKHYGNVIRGCRHGYVVGTVTGSTAPIMTGILIDNNTFVDITRYMISVWAATPAAALTVRNNFVLNAAQDIEAQSGTAGNQTWTTNAAVNVSTKYTGNNVGAGAVNHILLTAQQTTPNGLPKATSPLLTNGTDLNWQRDFDGRLGRSYIGAYSTTSVADERGVATQRNAR